MAPKKNLRLGVKPSVQSLSPSVEANTWIENRHGADAESSPPSSPQVEVQPTPELKRITFEVTKERHQQIKIYAASKGMSIKELMLDLIEQELQM
jgi:hypothetical protein